jgi:endonuclease YncB( thermonuclease family)
VVARKPVFDQKCLCINSVISVPRNNAVFILFIVALFSVPAGNAKADTVLTGTVTKVRDGDTIEVGRIPIRLNGVSAPEMNLAT